MDDLAKILKIFLQDEIDDHYKDIKLILFKNNQVVFYKTLNALQFELKQCGFDENIRFYRTGYLYYLYQLYILFYEYTIGDKYEIFINNDKNLVDWPKYDIEGEIRVLLMEENNLKLSIKYVELPILLRQVYIEYIKSKIEICMNLDNCFICLSEYCSWLTEEENDDLDDNNQVALTYFQKFEDLLKERGQG